MGSFTNHFRSKEAFAEEVLDRYFATSRDIVKEALEDKSLTPRQRLQRYLDIISGVLADDKWNRGCLIGDFSLETLSEQTLAREAGGNIPGMACSVCLVHRRGPNRR